MAKKKKKDVPQAMPSLPVRLYRQFGVPAVMLLVLIFYVWTAGSSGIPLVMAKNAKHDYSILGQNNDGINPGQVHYGYYNLLADAFLAGRLSLELEPPKELL